MNSTIRLILIAILFVSLPSNAQNVIDTWIIAGQSNCEGYGITESPVNGLTPSTTLSDIGRSDLNVIHNNIRFFQGVNGSNDISKSAGMTQAPKDLWHSMTSYEGMSFDWGNGLGGESGRRFGYELSFGYEIQQYLTEEIALIKFAKGGTSISSSTKQFNDGYWHDFDPIDSRLNQYDRLIATINNAVLNLPAGDVLKIKGILWMQGEADAKTTAKAIAYEANLTELMNQLLVNLEGISSSSNGKLVPEITWEETPFIVGTIATPGTNGDIIRTAQAAIAASKSNVYTVDATNNLSLMSVDDWGGNGIHYDTAGQVELGERFATEVLSTTYGNLSMGKFESQSNIGIRPNPASNSLELTNILTSSNYTIYSITGKQISTGRILPSETQIKISLLNAGVYFLKLGTGNVIRFIKR
ncbi:sialate O-acetylesterase [Polaribacter atrinae]|uniref:sialate O-acetylesterase n=1 Tax=Polaribacter atrinae TaxID=1333662 RepID=UPI00248FE250|nr:sialate O-acetylesterase [Polaribacter atrinae]